MSDENTPDAPANDRLQHLTDLLPTLRTWMDDAPVDRKAALVAQYRATLAEIAELTPDKPKGDAVDEIAERRSRRRGTAKGKDHAGRSG